MKVLAVEIYKAYMRSSKELMNGNFRLRQELSTE